MNFYCTLLPLLLSLLPATLPAAAQTPAAPHTAGRAPSPVTAADSAVRLEAHEVVARGYEEVIPAQRLSGQELEQMNSLSVADALRYFSGLQIKDYGGVAGLKTVNIRGMGSEQMGVYYNGIQLGNAQNGQVDLGKFSLDNIEEIALYNGQKSEIFQSAREFGASGNIYLTTRRPRFRDGKTANLRAALRAGSFGLINPSLLYEYKISDRISTTLNAEWTTASGKYKFRYRRKTPAGDVAYDTTATRQNGDIDAMRLEAGLQGGYDRGFWRIYLYHYSSERGVPGAIVNNVWRNGERLWDRNSFAQATLRHRFSRKLQLKANLKYAYDYTHYVNNDEKLLEVDNIYKQKEIYASAALCYDLTDWWQASAAYDIQWNQLSEYADVHRTTHWASVATALTLPRRLKLQASLLGTFIDEEARERTEPPSHRVLTPAAFLSWQPFEAGLVLRAFTKQAFRMPTFNDLYYTDMGNASLRPEKTTQYDAGLTYTLARPGRTLSYLEVGAEAYYNRVTDKIVAYPKGQQFRWTMLNLGKVDIRGIDAHAHVAAEPWRHWRLAAKLQYTYQRAIDVTDPADTYYRDQIPYIPRHSGSLVLMARWKKWSLNYSFIYVGERYNQQENIQYNYTQPWYTSDLSLLRELEVGRSRWKFTVEVNNLLSQDYEVILNYPMPKRNYRVGVVVEL